MPENGGAKKGIFIGTPYYNQYPWLYVLSMIITMKHLGEKYDIGVNLTQSVYVHGNRNIIIEEASKQPCDYLLFIDSDMVWRPDDIERLVRFDRDVVSGLYMTRKPYDGRDHAPVVYRYDRDHVLRPVYDLPPNVFKCDAVGAGFLLLKKHVVDRMVELTPKIGFPFDFITAEEMNTKPSGRTNLIGEDLSFCWRLRKAGFDIWCDPAVKVGHISESVIVCQ